KEYRTGFSISPWSALSLNAHFLHRDKESNYDHLRDIIPPPRGPSPDFGYSAFIRWREIVSDETSAKLTVKWPSWLKTTLEYKLVSADYRTRTDPIEIVSPFVITPGGTLMAGESDSDIYSVNF